MESQCVNAAHMPVVTRPESEQGISLGTGAPTVTRSCCVVVVPARPAKEI